MAPSCCKRSRSLPGTLGSKPHLHPRFIQMAVRATAFPPSSALPSASLAGHALVTRNSFLLLSPSTWNTLPSFTFTWGIPAHPRPWLRRSHFCAAALTTLSCRQPLGPSASPDPLQPSAPRSTEGALFPLLRPHQEASTAMEGFAFIPSVVLRTVTKLPSVQNAPWLHISLKAEVLFLKMYFYLFSSPRS